MARHLIGLDWGISSLRAYLMDGNGGILDTVSNSMGILHRGVLVEEDTPTSIINKHAMKNGDLEDAVVNIIGWKGDKDEEDAL